MAPRRPTPFHTGTEQRSAHLRTRGRAERAGKFGTWQLGRGTFARRRVWKRVGFRAAVLPKENRCTTHQVGANDGGASGVVTQSDQPATDQQPEREDRGRDELPPVGPARLATYDLLFDGAAVSRLGLQLRKKNRRRIGIHLRVSCDLSGTWNRATARLEHELASICNHVLRRPCAEGSGRLGDGVRWWFGGGGRRSDRLWTSRFPATHRAYASSAQSHIANRRRSSPSHEQAPLQPSAT